MLIANVAARRGRVWANLGNGLVARFNDNAWALDVTARQPRWRRLPWTAEATADTVPVGAAARVKASADVVRFWLRQRAPQSMDDGDVILSTVPRRYSWREGNQRVALTAVDGHLIVLDAFNVSLWHEAECSGLGPGRTAYGDRDPPVLGAVPSGSGSWAAQVGPAGITTVSLYAAGDGSLYALWHSPLGVAIRRHTAACLPGEPSLFVATSPGFWYLLDVSPDGRTIALCCHGYREVSLVFVDVPSRRVKQEFPCPGVDRRADFRCFGAYSLDGATFAFGGELDLLTRQRRMQIRVLDTE